jgi:predicted transcriptional regulator
LKGATVPRKITVNLPDEAVQAIQTYADEHQITFTEALRQFISRQKYFNDEIDSGSKLLIEKPDKSLREVVVA